MRHSLKVAGAAQMGQGPLLSFLLFLLPVHQPQSSLHLVKSHLSAGIPETEVYLPLLAVGHSFLNPSCKPLVQFSMSGSRALNSAGAPHLHPILPYAALGTRKDGG